MASCELDGAALTGFIDLIVGHDCRLYTRCDGTTRVTRACFKVCLSPYAATVLYLTALQFCMSSTTVYLSFHKGVTTVLSGFTCYAFGKTFSCLEHI